MRRRGLRAAAALLLGTVALLLPLAGMAAGNEVGERRADLVELRQRIEQLKREVAAGESSRAEAADQLRDSERAISDLQRELRDLAGQHDELRGILRDLGRQTRNIEAEIGAQQSRLDRLLVRRYISGTPDSLRLALSGQDPNQIARDLHYLQIIARTRADLLRELETLLGRQRDLAEQTRQQAAALAEVEKRQRQRHAEVARERDTRKQLLAKLASKIGSQRQEIGSLQRNEQRLARLIERLAKLAKASPPPRPSAPKATTSEKRNAEIVVDSSQTAASGVGGSFAKLRGSLRLPAAGTVVGRFGSTREGGGTWKGIFIRAGGGGEVKAIADGQVVFADWMRGFGNLMIVDHGDDYLSVYGYNDALLRQPGDVVRGGEVIASIGSSGGYPETGLYFEIRHQGQPQDPLKWSNLR